MRERKWLHKFSISKCQLVHNQSVINFIHQIFEVPSMVYMLVAALHSSFQYAFRENNFEISNECLSTNSLVYFKRKRMVFFSPIGLCIPSHWGQLRVGHYDTSHQSFMRPTFCHSEKSAFLQFWTFPPFRSQRHLANAECVTKQSARQSHVIVLDLIWNSQIASVDEASLIWAKMVRIHQDFLSPSCHPLLKLPPSGREFYTEYTGVVIFFERPF